MKPGVMELIVVLLIVVVIFGPTQIPRLAKMIGKSVKNLRAGMADGDEDEDEDESKPKSKTKAKAKAEAVEEDPAEEK